jgi:hypothetical protein
MGWSTAGRGGAKIPGMKRLVAAALWLYALWYLGSFVSMLLGVPDLLGPALGVTGGLLVGVDPRRLIWARPTGLLGNTQSASAAPSAA